MEYGTLECIILWILERIVLAPALIISPEI